MWLNQGMTDGWYGILRVKEQECWSGCMESFMSGWQWKEGELWMQDWKDLLLMTDDWLWINDDTAAVMTGESFVYEILKFASYLYHP